MSDRSTDEACKAPESQACRVCNEPVRCPRENYAWHQREAQLASQAARGSCTQDELHDVAVKWTLVHIGGSDWDDPIVKRVHELLCAVRRETVEQCAKVCEAWAREERVEVDGTTLVRNPVQIEAGRILASMIRSTLSVGNAPESQEKK